MAQGADAASTHLGEGSRGERRAAAREEEDGGDDDEPGGTTGRAGDLRISTIVSGDPVIVGAVFVHERVI